MGDEIKVGDSVSPAGRLDKVGTVMSRTNAGTVVIEYQNGDRDRLRADNVVKAEEATPPYTASVQED